jgi:hypothetical protein
VSRFLDQQGQHGGSHVAARSPASAATRTVPATAASTAGPTGTEATGTEATAAESARAEATGAEAPGTTEPAATAAQSTGTEAAGALLIVVRTELAVGEPGAEPRPEAGLGELAAAGSELAPPSSAPPGTSALVGRDLAAVCVAVCVVVSHGVSHLGAAVVRLSTPGCLLVGSV